MSNSVPFGATHVNSVNGKYFKVEGGVVVFTYGISNPNRNNGTMIKDCPWINEINSHENIEESTSDKIQSLKDLQINSVCDEYMKGLYNGLELAQSVIDNREPEFLE
ncbi:hypothetical protein NVP1231O_26 [Vibrio phage 1.231.O._10N.261.49.F8]|nr:hypothetical protein NVP1119O_26 [Vibrio phage 1.119.O._10N.261.51.A9]AUR89620.1 hypothetical protein NVP1127O_28 [Vibrio phage 1.127.O._10N.286.52.E12]AUR90398.1 hypothetical protein NVP1143O_26 [Vibrio phage 1.143.O._10N.261.55.C8]AUR96684.1 hypothetical protein NVP1231O_26 [Vibrio phage 1.231.O._10N.261.49.F8]